MAEVTLYRDANFQGPSASYAVGDFGTSVPIAENDQASSIKVPPGLVAIVYENADRAGGFGRYVDFLEDQPDLSLYQLNDQISWVTVLPATRPNDGWWIRNHYEGGRFYPGHWSGSQDPIPANPTPTVAPYAPPPSLVKPRTWGGQPWQNPSFDTSDPDWASKLVRGGKFDGTWGHPYEWVPIFSYHQATWTQGLLNGQQYMTANEQEDGVGVSGTVVCPHRSGNDIPFTHPFFNDYEFEVIVDPEYDHLLASGNRVPETAWQDWSWPLSEQQQSWADAHRAGYPAVTGSLAMEVEGQNVPDRNQPVTYEVDAGDRVVLFGRWIVDAGHPDFHTEIHPPLLMATAHCTDPQGEVCPPYDNAATRVKLWSRPWQTRQLFNDAGTVEPMRPYLISLFETLGSVDYWPQVFDKPFDGVYAYAIEIDPPVPRPGAAGGGLAFHLEASYYLVTNGACAVQLTANPANPDSLLLRMTFNSATYPAQPKPQEVSTSYTTANLLKESGADLSPIIAGVLSHLHGDVTMHTYRGAAPPNHESPSTVVPFTPLNQLPQSSIFTDAQQPFPLYGWVELRWAGLTPPIHPPLNPPIRAQATTAPAAPA